MILLIEPQLFPSASYLAIVAACLRQGGRVLLETQESYPKQTLRNRYWIMTSQGPKSLTVPVTYTQGEPTATVQLSYEQDWARQHWRSLQASYAKAPFWSHYEPMLSALWLQLEQQQLTTLIAFQDAALSICLQNIGLEDKMACVGHTQDFLPHKVFEPNAVSESATIDPTIELWFRAHALPTDTLVWDARNMLPKNPSAPQLEAKPYSQLFGQRFYPGMSALDLFFNTGPLALEYLPTVQLPATI